MRAYEILQEAPISNQPDHDPIGLTVYNQEADYHGLRVMMRPSKFLELAAPLSDLTANPFVDQHMAGGGNIASPFLMVRIPSAWEDDDFTTTTARVTNHEGRNRMRSWLKRHGDDPVEVHIFFRDGTKRRHITDKMIRLLRAELWPESNTAPRSKNNFDQVLN